MARNKDEIELLGTASAEELQPFAEAKKVDDEVLKEVLESKAGEKGGLSTSDEALRIKLAGEEAVAKVQKEINSLNIIDDELPDEPKEIKPSKLDIAKDLASIPAKKISSTTSFVKNSNVEFKIVLVKSILFILLVVVTISLVFFALNKRNKLTQTSINFSMPTNTTVDANYIYLNKDLFIEKTPYKLSKILIDNQDTIFYFNDNIDLQNKYSARLIDENAKDYQLDQHYMNSVKENNEGKVIAFSPLNNNINRFELQLIDNETQEVTKFDFTCSTYIKKPASVVAYNQDGQSKDDIQMENVHASGAGTNIDFTLNWGDTGYYYGIDDANNGNINVYQNGTIIPSKNGAITLYKFPGYNMDLAESVLVPLKDFTNSLNVTIDDLYKIFPINDVFNPHLLLLQKSVQVYNLDGYKLVIEGMQKQDNQVVLVFHVDNLNYVQPPSTPVPSPTAKNSDGFVAAASLNNNIESSQAPTATPIPFKLNKISNNSPTMYAILDADLVVHKQNEPDKIIKGVLHTGQQGGDILYTDDSLAGITSESFDVKINFVKIKEADYSATLNLTSNKSENSKVDAEISKGESNIIDSFNKRLSFKSAEITRSKITGFDESILLQENLQQMYAPADLTERAVFSARIISSAYRNGKIFCAVQEDWRGQTTTGFVHSVMNHYVVYDTSSQLIVSDSISN